MDVRDRVREALILKARDYRDQDRLLTLVSVEDGPELAISRGARKPGGSLRGVSQPYSRAELVLSPPKNGLSFLREGVPLESYISLDDELPRFAYAAYLSELLLAAWPPQKSAPELYALALTAFTLLKLDDDHQRTARFFELRLLAALGLMPPLTACHSCGQSVLGRQFQLSPSRGALLCASCGRGDPAPRVSAGAILTMRLLLSVPLSRLPALRLTRPIAAELEQSLAYYLDYHLDGAGRAKSVLRELLG